jgi:hypothetical protein
VDESQSWPPRHAGPMFKTKTRTIEKQRRRYLVARQERTNKLTAAARDGFRCRFPFCGCRERGYNPEVAHLTHKGMGGDPKGLRSQVDNLITLCGWRHREGVISLHKGTLRVLPRTADGTNGPVSWQMEACAFAGEPGEYWILIAREERVGVLEPVTDSAPLIVLEKLSRMER